MWLETFVPAIRRVVVLATGLLAVVLATSPLMAAPVPLATVMASPAQGTWRTLNGTEISIAPCPEGFCGALTYITIPKKNADQCRATDKTAFAQLMLDYNNKDKALQMRPLLGLTMLTLKPTSDPTSFTAKVYNPEDGSSNDVQVFIIDNGATLRIGGGCLGTMCVQSQDWPRVADRLAPDFTCEGGQ